MATEFWVPVGNIKIIMEGQKKQTNEKIIWERDETIKLIREIRRIQ